MAAAAPHEQVHPRYDHAKSIDDLPRNTPATIDPQYKYVEQSKWFEDRRLGRQGSSGGGYRAGGSGGQIEIEPSLAARERCTIAWPVSAAIISATMRR